MNVIDNLARRSEDFTARNFSSELKIVPSLKTIIIGCLDPRVDPAEVFNLKAGEAAVIRNVGGRVTPDVFETMAMLQIVSAANGGQLGPGWNVIVLHHTDCGINALVHSEDMLTKYFGVSASELESLAITDPYTSVKIDVAAFKANPHLSGAFVVTGVVYDVATGHYDVTVPSTGLRSE